MGQIQTPIAAQELIKVLHDKKSLVRYHAIRSLQNFPPQVWLSSAEQALSDKVRAVRIAAADLFHRLPLDALPPSAKTVYLAAEKENRNYLEYQTDFAVSNVMLADYELQSGDNANAIIHYMRGLKKDSLMNYARLNLSAAYNAYGKNKEALKTLQDAALIDPSNDRIFYNLGLLYYELKNTTAALTNLQKATQLGSTDPSVYYNYGLLLQQQEKPKEAEQIFLKGYALNPMASNINYALAYLYFRENLPQKARSHAEVLQRIDPLNPEYQQLFRSLGL